MIVSYSNKKKINPYRFLDVMTWINQDKREFHLTGSRAFNLSRLNSDYDFFVKDETSHVVNPLIKDLTKMGFSKLPSHSYDFVEKTDPSVNSIYRWKVGNQQIDIQLITPEYMDSKIEVNEFLKQNPSLICCDKHTNAMTWKALIGHIKYVKDRTTNNNFQ